MFINSATSWWIKKKKSGKLVICLQTTKSLLVFFNNSLRHQMGFVLFDKLCFYLLYLLRSLAFRLIISWNFSLLSIYYCSSECTGAVWAWAGSQTHSVLTHYLWVQFNHQLLGRDRNCRARTSDSLVLNPSGWTDCKLPIANMICSNLASC